MNKQISKSFNILYNTMDSIKHMTVDADDIYVKDQESGKFIKVGEIIPEEAEKIAKKIKNAKKEDLSFFVTFQASLMAIINELTPTELKLLMYMSCKAKYGNKVYDLGYNEITAEAKMAKSTIVTSIRKLKKKGLIIAKVKKQRSTYTLNPALFWRGSFYGMKGALDEFVDSKISKDI